MRIAAVGRWDGIHSALGINILNTKKHTSCPGCGGRDRFRLCTDYADTGRWICGGGGDLQSGDGFSLLGHVFGWTPVEQLKAVADYLGLSNASDKEREELRRKAEAQAAAMQADAQRKHEQARRDSNLLTMLDDLIDTIKHRQFLQRQINGRVTWQPSLDEMQAAQGLNAAILDAYAATEGVDYD